MMRDELRQQMLGDIDQLLGSVAWRFLNQEQRALTLACQTALAEDDAVTNGWLDKLLALLPREMDMPKLSAAAEKAFAAAGRTLTPRKKEMAALGETLYAIDWTKVLQLGIMIAEIILALIGGNNPPPTPTPALYMPDGSTLFEGWHKALESSIHTTALIAKHCSACCE